MKAIRILLQVVIAGAGALALAALLSQPTRDFPSIAMLLLFLGFLLALTLMLKEHTEERLTPSHQPNSRPAAIAVFLLGVVGLSLGVSYLSGFEPLPDGSGNCRTICWLILLATQASGEPVGKLVAFAIWSALGLFLCLVGYRLIRARGI